MSTAEKYAIDLQAVIQNLQKEVTQISNTLVSAYDAQTESALKERIEDMQAMWSEIHETLQNLQTSVNSFNKKVAREKAAEERLAQRLQEPAKKDTLGARSAEDVFLDAAEPLAQQHDAYVDVLINKEIVRLTALAARLEKDKEAIEKENKRLNVKINMQKWYLDLAYKREAAVQSLADEMKTLFKRLQEIGFR